MHILREHLDYSMSEGQSIRVKECPNCEGQGTSNAVQITRKEDGFLWTCFRCYNGGAPYHSGFFPDEGASATEVAKLMDRTKKQDNRPEIAELPADCRPLIPKAAVFLYNYYFEPDDIERHGICWSPSHKRIIFPVHRGTTLIGWAGRKLDELDPENKMPKWHVLRQRDIKHMWYTVRPVVPTGKKQVVIVEDNLSAIRIAAAGECAISLITTYLPHEMYNLLAGWEVCIWLDQDAYDKACKYQAKLGNYGIRSATTLTEKDPKAYSPDQIMDKIQWPSLDGP